MSSYPSPTDLFQRNAFALLDLQGKRLQRWNILARVNNRHILKRNSATARLNQQIRTIVLLPFSINRIEDALGATEILAKVPFSPERC